MTNFYNYINEKDELDNIINILKTKCKNNLKDTLNGHIIYKGMIDIPKKYFIDYKENRKERKSRNTQNYYTIMFSEILESWKYYPKRNKGIICSNTYKYARSYGQVYVVIPFDNTEIGVCSKNDIWYSFNRTFDKIFQDGYVDDLGKFNFLFFKSLEIKEDKKSIENFLKKTTLDEFLELNKQKNRWVNKWNILNYYYKTQSMLEVYNDLFDPTKNKFLHTKNIKEITPRRELWFDGSCVFIDIDVFYEIKDKLK